MRRQRATPIVVNFDPESVRAPLLLRCAAFLIDYSLILVVPVLALLFGRMLGNDGSKLLNSEVSSLGWTVALLVGIANLFLLPMYCCQSVGKMVTGLKIVAGDGGPPSLGRLLLRHTVGYLATAATLGIGLLMAVVGRRGTALHDRLSGTLVIFAEETAVEARTTRS